ncbi:MAG: D-sedoheptulose-7-phosphate isomerase [Paludibacteraceae bacterium]
MNIFLNDLIKRYPPLSDLKEKIWFTYEIILESLRNGGTVFTCGNGGSASDSEHIAGELLKGFVLKRELKEDIKRKFFEKFGEDGAKLAGKLQYGLRAISLTSHPAFITAFANDVDADLIFAQQLFGLGRKNDVLIAISTSGNSANIYNSILTASMMGVKTVLMTGKIGGRCASLVDIVLKVPEHEAYKIQEYHLPIYHTLCLMIEDYFYGKRS